jgi:hypothetical protein
MNDVKDIIALKIAQYLENDMSPGEEMAFMEELTRDEVLRKSFEEELLLREVLAKHVGVLDAQSSAEVPVAEPSPATPVTRVLSLFRVRAVAAACVAIILTSVLVARLPVFEHRNAPVPDEPFQVGADEAIRSAFKGTDQALAGMTANSLFAQFYSTYAGEKDPVEISLYYQRYRVHDYTSVLAAREEDYGLMGTGTKTNMLNQYMQLYRGLSYLAEKRPLPALSQFDSLLNSPHTIKEVYCTAQWYAALSSLQRKDIPADSALAAAARAARAIGQTASPFRRNAARLSASLSSFRP